MERCDFSSVMSIIRQYISEGGNVDQLDLLYNLFDSYMMTVDPANFAFDNGQVCRWLNGQAKVSPAIIKFYAKDFGCEYLAGDIERNVFKWLVDPGMVCQKVYDLVLLDTTISEQERQKQLGQANFETERTQAEFLAKILCFALQRPFVKRDAQMQKRLTAGALSPLVTDYIYTESIPRPCKQFCGREKELAQVHKLLQEDGKVFISGLPGIGKSELAKAYAQQYRKEYTNVLSLTYSGDLRQDIIEMDFADDLPNEDDDTRFRKHNRFLRGLRADTLLIIDNFNALAAEDELLPVLLKYRCHILFTTRSRFDEYTFLELTEIEDDEALFRLSAFFYRKAEKHRNEIMQIIYAVHRHTLAVELAARLLQVGILSPARLLRKLEKERAALDASDKITMSKDGRSSKQTYAQHIRTLFSLYRLNAKKKETMRSMALVPATGIPTRLFAEWMGWRNLNPVNDLIEMGLIQERPHRMAALHPLVQEVTVADLKPSFTNCRKLIVAVHKQCILHGVETPEYKLLFQIAENVIQFAEKDDMLEYLIFLEDVFDHMEKYNYLSGMDKVQEELASQLADPAVGDVRNRVLLLDEQAVLALRKNDYTKAEDLLLDAVNMLPPVTDQLSAYLAANIYGNIGGLYRQIRKPQLAYEYMAKGIELMREYELTYTNDCVIQACNYSILAAEMGKFDQAIELLQACMRAVAERHPERNSDYAMLQEAMGSIYLAMGNVPKSIQYFRDSLALYNELWHSTPETIQSKTQQICEFLDQASPHLKKLLLAAPDAATDAATDTATV